MIPERGHQDSSSSWSSIVGRMKYVMAVRAYNAIHRPQTTLLPVLTSCTRGDTICPRPSPPPVGAQAPRAPPSRRNVAILSHAEYVLTLTAAAALRVKAALSKAAW